jgi:hypothetical protein
VLADTNALAANDKELDAVANALANNDEVLADATAIAATKNTHIVPEKFTVKENTKDTHIVPKKNDVKGDKPEEPAVESTTLEAPPSLPPKTVKKKFAVKENTKDTHIVPEKNKPAVSKKIGVEFITYKQVSTDCLGVFSREPRMRRLTLGTTTLTTPLNILKTNCTNMLIVQTNVHQLTANSPIIHTPRDTVKKPNSALNANRDLHTLAIIPIDHMKTHKMEFDMLNTDRNVAKEYEEYVKYEEHKEIDEESYAPRNTVKKPQPALNAHEDLPTVATAPLDQVETHKTELPC